MPRVFLQHIFLVRTISIFVIPVLIVTIPTVAYRRDMAAGEIPTQREWDAASHSSGPWAGSLVQWTSLFLTLGGLLVSAVGARRDKVRKAPIGIWVAHASLVIAAALFVAKLYGYLME